jgi:DNA-binding NtrC family response regulator
MQPGILIVDDEQLIRWSLSARLSREGYRIVEAETAAQAVDRARDGIDLILLDYRLPDADGLEVLKRVKQTSPDVLVIMLTAHSSIETAVEAMKHGAYHFASKPFDVDEVALLV